VIVELDGLAPAAEEGWDTLFDLNEVDAPSWLLVGGQMMHLLSVEHAAAIVRPTDDVDVVVDVRTRPNGTRWLSAWLQDRGFTFEGASPDQIGHRFARPASRGPGTVVFDVLAPEGLGRRASLITVPPNRTVQVPGTVQALQRSRLLTVRITSLVGRPPRVGTVRCPNLLGALVGKAAATTIAVRTNPDRDWQDAALLLSVIADPMAVAEKCDRKDRRRLRLLKPLEDPAHRGWQNLDATARAAGIGALSFLIG
jgi:hypothetical protein